MGSKEQDKLPLILIHRLPQFNLPPIFTSRLQTLFRIIDPASQSHSHSEEFLSVVRALLCLDPAPLHSQTLDLLPSLQCVVATSSGVDHIDLDQCRRRRIAVANAGPAFAADVAEYAVALLIDVLRRLSASHRYVRAGLWPLHGDYCLGSKVHFAATKEALSLHFAKFGVVLSVVILTDTLNGQPKGSAYITFANKESVDKAVALSGTSLFSRTLKVLRKAEEATMISTTPQRAGKPAQAQFSRINRKTPFDRPFHPNSRLQWRREPTSAPSEPSASITQKKGVGSAASLASVSTTKTATSSTGTPAAA